MNRILTTVAIILMSAQVFANMDKPTPLVRITTNKGDIIVRLYDDTPVHRDNFLKLVSQHFYDGTLFHRVINKFMIQAGDPDSKNAAPSARLGAGDVGYTLPAEIVYPTHFHKRGALCAARQSDQVNPEKRSSGCQFYIVTGNIYTPGQLQQFAQRSLQQRGQQLFDKLAEAHVDSIRAMYSRKDEAGLRKLQEQLTAEVQKQLAQEAGSVYTEEQEDAYTTVGGTPHLDGDYTVFGEVVEGMNIVSEIQLVETDSSDRPLENVVILSMSIVE